MAESGEEEAPGSKHRPAFLQMLIARKIVTTDEARKAMETICERCRVPVPDLSQFVRDINEGLKEIFMEIRTGVSEESGVVHYALVNTYEDVAAKVAASYDRKLLTYFNKVMEMIVREGNGLASSTDLINAGQGIETPITNSDAKEALDLFTKDHWLYYDRTEGDYWVGTRSLIELKRHLRSTFSDVITDCYMCRDIVIKGELCDEKKMHHHCARRYVQTQNRV
ncbi:non-structural maintenance of chromosomes element 1 homolog [Oscarella lobularis]|uniref:non-structural maintenance of chromosomes element 1 homolog n=1 Tax=Oscarella lobularis TaxID=121494 RepID=UPI003313DB7E